MKKSIYFFGFVCTLRGTLAGSSGSGAAGLLLAAEFFGFGFGATLLFGRGMLLERDSNVRASWALGETWGRTSTTLYNMERILQNIFYIYCCFPGVEWTLDSNIVISKWILDQLFKLRVRHFGRFLVQLSDRAFIPEVREVRNHKGRSGIMVDTMYCMEKWLIKWLIHGTSKCRTQSKSVWVLEILVESG